MSSMLQVYIYLKSDALNIQQLAFKDTSYQAELKSSLEEFTK